MQSYFPYSFIINLVHDITASMSRHPYFGEWAVCGADSKEQSPSCPGEISELYY